MDGKMASNGRRWYRLNNENGRFNSHLVDESVDPFDEEMLQVAGSARLVFFGKEEEEDDVHVLPNSCRQCRTPAYFDGTPDGDACADDCAGAANPVAAPMPLPINDDVPLLDRLGDDDDNDVHCHVQRRTTYSKKVRNRLIISSTLCLIFMIGEIIGGYMASSLAIMTDAAHLLGDLTSFLIGLFAIWVGGKQSTRKMTFGYLRAEILGAFVSVILVWAMTGILLFFAIRRLILQDYEINADMMIIIAGVGVAMNLIMGVVLHGMCNCHVHSHGHSHGHLHGHGHSHGSTENINIRAAMMHVIGDLVQSIGVLVAAYVIKYKPEYRIADPICTFIFSILVVFTTIPVVRDTTHVLMEGFPHGLNYTAIKEDFQQIAGVRMVHSLHIWSLSLEKNALSVHLAIDRTTDSNVILQIATKLCQEKYRIHFSSIQVELYQPSIMLSCQRCKGPET